MKIYLYIFPENCLLTNKIVCLISTLYIITFLISLYCFYYVVLMLAIDNRLPVSCFNKLSYEKCLYRTSSTRINVIDRLLNQINA